MSKAEEAAMKAYPDYPTMDGGYISQRRPRKMFIQGYEQAEKDLGWHSVDESLPHIDEEVIVLTDLGGFNPSRCPLRICFAHLVDEDETITVQEKPYKPLSYNNWNIPGVKFWMPYPKILDEDE